MQEESAGTAITCVVAQGDDSLVESISNVLTAHGVEVVASATDGSAALAAIEAHGPRVAIVDLLMPLLDGIQVARRASESRPSTATILFCEQAEREQLAEALQAGMRGFVHRDGTQDKELLRAVTLTAEGATYVDPFFAPTLLHGSVVRLTAHVSPRESEILRLLADGKTNEEIGEALHISPHTVRSHLRAAMRKLEADNRTQAVAIALRQALID
jgi:DNA-binding NarL/FixJ family response regulator